MRKMASLSIQDGDEKECRILINLEETFANVETSFNLMLAEMEEDPKLSQFIDAYSNLFDFLYNEHVKAVELEATTSGLRKESEEVELRLIESRNILMEDAIIINDLKDNIVSTHRDLDQAHAREQAAKEIIDNLRRTITSLEMEIEFKQKMADINTDESTIVTKHRQGLERENVRLVQEVVKLNEKLDAALAYQEELEHRTDVTDVQIHEISDKLNDTEAQVDKYNLHKEKLEFELILQREELARKTSDGLVMQQFVTNDVHIMAKINADIKEQTDDIDKCIKTLESWNVKYCRMQMEYDTLSYRALTIKAENDKNFRSLSLESEKLEKFKADFDEVHKMKKVMEESFQQLHNECLIMLKERNMLHDEVVLIENKVQEQKIMMDMYKREIINQMREKDIIRRNISVQSRHNNQQAEIIKNIHATKMKVETEMVAHLQHQAKQKKEIIYLDRERDRLAEEADDNVKLMEELMEKTRANKMCLFEVKKKLAEMKSRQRTQQNLFDACKSDTRALTKTQTVLSIQFNTLRNKLKEAELSFKLYVGEIEAKAHEIENNRDSSECAQNEIEAWKEELKLCLQNIAVSKTHDAKLKMDIKGYHKSIEVSDQQIRASDKVIVSLVNERDLLAAQLYARNDELCLLYDKTKILLFMLWAGNVQYNLRLKDAHMMMLEIKRLRQEKLILVTSISNMNDLQTEVFHLEVDLTRERVKSKMLEHELQYPSNIHRWRKLEASNPELFIFMQNILLLQKKILMQSKLLGEKEIQLIEVKKLYNNFRHMVSKQPGPQLGERLEQIKGKLQIDKLEQQQLLREMAILRRENVKCNSVMADATLKVRNERQKLAMAKRSRRKIQEKKRALEQKGQEVLDDMGKLMQPRTIMAISMMALTRRKSASSYASSM